MNDASAAPGNGNGWSIMDRTLELLAVHCNTVAYEEPGGWECAFCGVYSHTRDIPGWAERRAQLTSTLRKA